MEMQELKDAPKVEATPEQMKADALKNQLGVVSIVEKLFHGINAGSFPLRVHDDVLGGMNFLAQFHKQLVSQLPPEVVNALKASAGQATPAAAPETPNEQPKA